jgi:putative tryptophan/tyrosine transport system substrate-binding protein
MQRRDFITLLGGAAAAWPRATEAQQSNRVRHVGVLFVRAENDPEGQAHAQVFEQEMQKLGWAQDHNVRFDYRWAAGDAERISTFAKQIVDARPDVIVGHTTAAVAALLRETRTIPIVFVAVTDPIGSGFVASLSRPGGNVTGFIDLEPSLGSKWVELLKQMAPNLTRLGCMFNPTTAAGGGSYYMGSVETAASSLGVQAVATPAHNAEDIERVLTSLTGDPAGGLVVMPDIFNGIHRSLIISTANHLRVPAVYAFRFFAASGGLASYGINLTDLFRRGASYADRMLRGATAADLPVQLPTKFELVINLKTAKDLGLEVPPSLLARADEVFE